MYRISYLRPEADVLDFRYFDTLESLAEWFENCRKIPNTTIIIYNIEKAE